MRQIAVVTGTRAEYGILYPVLKAIEVCPNLQLSLIVTGMHLSHEFGYTVREIERDGFKISAKVDMLLSSDTPAAMAQSVGLGITSMAQVWEQLKPDIVVILGDRIEPLAAAITGVFMTIPVAHIHGGEVSGNIDDSVRHAITKFAHIHFATTPLGAERIAKMGEEPWRIHVVGPLGIYAMGQADFIPKAQLCKTLRLNNGKAIILVVQHPVTTQVGQAAEQMRETMEALVELKEQAVVICPNADAGGRSMMRAIREYENYPLIRILENLPYLDFISLMRVADLMAGNSSAAIVDAPLFGLPAVNIGIRQEGRERGENIIDVPHKKERIVAAVKKALSGKDLKRHLQQASNPYNVERDGARKLAEILSTIEISEKLLQKKLSY